MQDKFTTLTATAVPINIENIDTDQIIPARFLKATDKTGFGSRLFYDWRSEPNGQLKKDFVLNQNSYKGEILIAGKTSVAVRAGNMPPGPFGEPASEPSSPAILRTSFVTTH